MAEPWEGSVVVKEGFPDLVGIEFLGADEEQASGRVAVTDKVKQPFGLVHGGVYPTLAESICSYASSLAVWPEGKMAVGQSNNATFLRPILEGHVNARARTRHRGRTTWVWEVEMTDDEGRLCALVQMTIAIRDLPEGTGPGG